MQALALKTVSGEAVALESLYPKSHWTLLVFLRHLG